MIRRILARINRAMPIVVVVLAVTCLHLFGPAFALLWEPF